MENINPQQPENVAVQEQNSAINAYNNLDRYSRNTVFPVGDEQYFDYGKAVIDGLSAFDIEAISSKGSLAVKIPESMYAYRDMLPNLNDEELTEVYSSILDSYASYREGQYSKLVSNIGIMPDSRLFKHMGLANAYTSKDVRKGSAMGHTDIDGYVQVLSEEEYAIRVGLAYDAKHDIWTNLANIGDKKALTVQHAFDPSQPETFYEMRNWSEDLSEEQIRSIWGDSSLQRSDIFTSIGKGLWESTIPSLGKALAWTVDKPVDLYEWITTGEITGNKRSDRFANTVGNYSGAMSHRNVDQMGRSFENWQSFTLNLGTLVGQLITMRAVGATAFHAIKGVSPIIAQKAANFAGMGHMAAYMSYEMDQEMAKMGWSEEMRTTLSFATFPIIFATERIIGPNNMTNFLRSEGRQIQKAVISDMPKEMANNIRKNTAKNALKDKTTKATFLERTRAGLEDFGRKIGEIADGGNILANMVQQGWEETRQEFTEETLEIALKTIGDRYVKYTAQKLYDYYGAATFDDDGNKIFYPDGRIEELSPEEYEAAKLDYIQAVDVIENKEGLFNYTFEQWWQNSSEASAMGFFGGMTGGAMFFNRTNAKSANQKKMLFQEMAIDVAQDPKKMQVVQATIDKMVDKGMMGRTDVDVNGESIAKSGEQSQAAVNAQIILEELQANINLAKEFDINNPVILKVNGGDKSMINELFDLKKKKKAQEAELQGLDESNLGEDEKAAKKAQLTESLEHITAEIERYSTPDGDSKYSQAYNDRAKEMIGSFKFSQKYVFENFNHEYNAALEKHEEAYREMEDDARLIAQTIQNLKKTPIDKQSKETKKQIRDLEKQLADKSKDIAKKRADIDKAASDMSNAFKTYKTKNKEQYWNKLLEASFINFHYKDYRSFVEGGSLDSIIEQINEERNNILKSREDATTAMESQLNRLAELQTRLEGLQEWQSGEGLRNSTEFKSILKDLGSTLEALNSIDSDHGFNNAFAEMTQTLSSFFGQEFFDRLGKMVNRDRANMIMDLNSNKEFDFDIDDLSTTLGEYKQMRNQKADSPELHSEIDQLSERLEDGELSQEEYVSISQQIKDLNSQVDQNAKEASEMDERIEIYDEYGQDDQAVGDILQVASNDSYDQIKFADEHFPWVNNASDMIGDSFERLKNPGKESTKILDRNNLEPQDWLDIYLGDITNEIQSMKEKAENGDIADPKQAMETIEKAIAKIAVRSGNVLFQSAFDEMSKNESQKEHLKEGVDYGIPFNDALMMSYKMKSFMQQLQSLQSTFEAIAGSRSMRQVKANAKNLEFQRLSLHHMLMQAGDILGTEFREIVESIREIDHDAESVEDIEKSIAENENKILRARQLIYNNRDKILSEKNFKKLFFSDSGKFLFLGGRPQGFTLLVDQLGVDYLNDDFNPGETITQQRDNHDKTGYMVFMTFLEESVALDPFKLYSMEKALLEKARNSDDKVASAEQMMSIRQTVAFMDAGYAEVMSKLSSLIVNEADGVQKKASQAALKRLLFNAVFMRGNPGVGKTNVMLPNAIEFYMEINDLKALKIRIVDPTGDLKSRLTELNDSFKGERKIEIEVIDEYDAIHKGFDEDHDLLVWDEASRLKDAHIDKIKKHGKTKPMIFLGDESQMQSIDDASTMSSASRRMYRTTPVSTSYRSAVYQIDDLRNAFRKKIIDSNEDIDFPKLFADVVDGKRVGAKYVASEDAVINDFFESNSKDKGLVFLRVEDVQDFYNAIKNGSRKHDWDKIKNNIYVLVKNLDTDAAQEVGGVKITSIQGMSIDEAYVHISFNQLKGIGNKTLPGRAGLTAVSRARNYVSLVGPTALNMNSSNQVVWNPKALQGESVEQLEEARNQLELDRANRIDHLDNALDGLEESGIKVPKGGDNKPSDRKTMIDHLTERLFNDPNLKTLSDESRAFLRSDLKGAFLVYHNLKSMLEQNGMKNRDLLFELYIPFANEVDGWVEQFANKLVKDPNRRNNLSEDNQKFYDTFKDAIEKIVRDHVIKNNDPDVEEYLKALNDVQIKNHDGSATSTRLEVGASVVDANGNLKTIQDIFNLNGETFVRFAGSKRKFNLNSLKDFRLPKPVAETSLEGNMHSESALHFKDFSAFYSSTATVPVPVGTKISKEDVNTIRGIKVDFARRYKGKTKLEYHASKETWNDRAGKATPFSHVFLIKAANEGAVNAYLNNNQSAKMDALINKYGKVFLVEAISTISSLGSVQVDYFTNAKISESPKESELKSIEDQINHGFRSENNNDQYRQENIVLNLARLNMLREAIKNKNGNEPVDLGEAHLQEGLTVNDRVVYKFDSNGRSFSEFVAENNLKDISFDLDSAVAKQFERKDGSRYWAYVVPWKRGNSNMNGEVIVTMPNLRMMLEGNMDYSSVLNQFNEAVKEMKKFKGEDSFFSALNKSIIGKMLNSSRTTFMQMINDNNIVSEFLEIRDGEVELKGENDQEMIDSAEALVNAIKGYLEQDSKFSKMGEVYLPFNKNSDLLQTKATLIPEPQHYYSPEATFFDPDGTPPETVGAKRPPRRGFTNRVEDSASMSEPRISAKQAEDIIRAILGDAFVEQNMEFSNDLGAHENLRILGMMANGKIKILLEEDGVRSRTPKHEALHVVFNYMINPDIKESLLEYGRERRAYEDGVDVEDINDIQAEEWLADEYAYRGNEALHSGEPNLWDRFVNWVGKIAHSVGAFKNELDFLFWQMNRGVYRDHAINNADNIVRHALEADESEVESAQGTKKKHDSSMLLEIFGDMKSAEMISFNFAKEIYALSPLAGYKGSSDFADALRLFEKFATSEEYVGSIDPDQVLESTGKALKDTRAEDVKQILNNSDEAWMYFDYVMQNKDIREAMIEKTFPGVDVETLDYHNAGEHSQYDDSSLNDFRKKTNDFIRLAVRTTPFFSFSLDENGNIVREESNGFVDFEDLQNALMLAAIEVRKKGVNFREEGLTSFIEELKAAAFKDGIDSRRGRNILSFVNRLTSLDPSTKGILDLLQDSKDKKQTKFMNEFVNGLLSTYLSLYQKEVVDFSVKGYDKDKLRIKKLVFEGNNANKFKTRLKSNIQSFVLGDGGQVKQSVHERLNKQFTIDSTGLKSANGTTIIKLDNGRYVFENHKDLNTMVRSVMENLGLAILPKRGFTLMMRDTDNNLTRHKSTYKHIRDMITQVNESKVGDMTPRDFMADNLMKMLLSINHNMDFFTKAQQFAKDKGSEATQQELNSIFAGSDYHDILSKSLRNVDQAYDIDEVSADLNYNVFKPTDFYKFFEILGAVKAQTTTYGGLNFFYRADGKKEYLFGLSSGFFESFAKGITKTKETLSRNGIKSKNLLLTDFTPYTVENVEEIKGIKQADINKGTVKPNTSDLLTIGLNLFLDSMASTETKLKMSFMNTNISDSGYMYATTYGVSSVQDMFLQGAHGSDFRRAVVNNEAINKALKSVYDKFIDDHDASVNRWKVVFGQEANTTGELLPTEIFAKIDQGSKTRINPDADIIEELTRINEVFRSYNEAQTEALRDAVLNSDLVLNRDYVIEKGVVQFGKATSGNIDLTNGRAYSIYNISDAKMFAELASKGDEGLTAFRREAFGKEYFNFVNMMNKFNAKVSRDYMLPKKNGNGAFGDGYAIGQVQDADGKTKSVKSADWNPVMEAYFMGYHIMNSSFNELWLGTQFQYGGFSTSDISKRSKPYVTPGTTPGRIDPMNDPDGMGTKSQIVVVTDEILQGMGFDEEAYNTFVEATDGIGYTSPLFYKHMDHSFGGRFSSMDKGMRKPVTSYNDPISGTSIQIKQAEHVLSYDVFSNSLIAERMLKEMLNVTEDGLADIFMEAFEAAGGHNAGHAAFDIAIEQTSDYVKDNGLHNRLVWQFVNPSAIKTGIRRVNKYSLDEGFANPNEISTIEIDSHEIRMILNPYQDFNDNERMAAPTQMLAIMGIGKQNAERITQVNSNLSKIFDRAFNGVMKQLTKNPDEYISDVLTRAVEAMPTFGNFAEMINNPKISLNLPQLTEKAQQIISNNITKEGTRRKYAGLRASQAPGSLFDVYERDGKTYMLNDIRREGGVTYDENGVPQVDASYTKRKLKPMTKKEAAEVIVPFSYMQKFGVKPTESLQDIYSIKLNVPVDGKNSINFNVGEKFDVAKLKDFIVKNYDKIDIENTPLMRAMNRLAQDLNPNIPQEELGGNTIGARMEGFEALQKLRDQMSQETDFKAELLSNLDRIDNYFNALEESLNLFAVRIPTSNLGSGFRGRVVGFINDMGNTIYTSEFKNILDGSDYDIDQLSIFLKFVNNDFTMPESSSIKGMQNEIVQAMQDVYKTESENDQDIYNMLSLDKLSKLADNFEKKTEKVVNDPGHNADDYTASMQGAESIDRFANLSSVYSYISQLPIQKIRQVIPWAADAIGQNVKGEESIIHRLGLFLNSSMDNAKVLINGRIGVTKDATNVVGAMLLSGYDIDQIANFLQSDVIKKIYELVERGTGVTESARDFDPYLQATTMLKNIAKKIGIKGDYGSTDASAEVTQADIDQMVEKGLITYEDENNNPCTPTLTAADGLTNSTKGTNWKIVKDFKGHPKHSQGGVDISISDKGVFMTKGNTTFKAEHGLLIANNELK